MRRPGRKMVNGVPDAMAERLRQIRFVSQHAEQMQNEKRHLVLPVDADRAARCRVKTFQSITSSRNRPNVRSKK